MRYFPGIISVAILFCPLIINAQVENEYLDLLSKKDPAQLYFEYYILPGGEMDTLLVPFRIENDFLTFRETTKNNNPQYNASITLFLDLLQHPKEKIKNQDRLIATTSWNGSKVEYDYENTQSRKFSLQGYMKLPISNEEYDLVLRIKDDLVDRELSSRRISIDNRDKNQIFGYIIEEITSTKGTLPLLNMGEYALYGENFNYTFLIPITINTDKLNIEVTEVTVTKKDTLDKKLMFERAFQDDEIQTHRRLSIDYSFQDPVLTTIPDSSYTLITSLIPNRNFPNSYYRIALINTADSTRIYDNVVRSYWRDIPTSLLSLNVSVEFLSMLDGDETVKNIKSMSSTSNKINAFQSFWKKRDPSPDTDFNELMAEYYSRIDEAFAKFSDPREFGITSDRGKIYILFGPPDNVMRSFPKKNSVIEVWEYPNRSFKFMSNAGFNTFKLVPDNK